MVVVDKKLILMLNGSKNLQTIFLISNCKRKLTKLLILINITTKNINYNFNYPLRQLRCKLTTAIILN